MMSAEVQMISQVSSEHDYGWGQQHHGMQNYKKH
jgi:hypothetical protein